MLKHHTTSSQYELCFVDVSVSKSVVSLFESRLVCRLVSRIVGLSVSSTVGLSACPSVVRSVCRYGVVSVVWLPISKQYIFYIT